MTQMHRNTRLHPHHTHRRGRETFARRSGQLAAEEATDAYQAELRAIVAAGVASGDFDVEDVDVATLLTLSTLNWSYQWLDPRGRLPLEELTAFYTEYVLGALGAGKGAQR
mgnify:CR=1 FL=1